MRNIAKLDIWRAHKVNVRRPWRISPIYQKKAYNISFHFKKIKKVYMPQVSCGQRSDRYPCTATGRVDSRTNGDVLASSNLHKQL